MEIKAGNSFELNGHLWTIQHVAPYGPRNQVVVLRDGNTQTSMLASELRKMYEDKVGK